MISRFIYLVPKREYRETSHNLRHVPKIVGGLFVGKIFKSIKIRSRWCILPVSYTHLGNAGIAQQAECVAIKADDLDGLLAFAQQNQIDLTVVGPEVPLTCLLYTS